ncbi:DUF7563 family protein [Haloterrigena salifodinae]
MPAEDGVTMPEWEECGGFVTQDFIRVFGIGGEVHSCPHCMTNRELGAVRQPRGPSDRRRSGVRCCQTYPLPDPAQLPWSYPCSRDHRTATLQSPGRRDALQVLLQRVPRSTSDWESKTRPDPGPTM